MAAIGFIYAQRMHYPVLVFRSVGEATRIPLINPRFIGEIHNNALATVTPTSHYSKKNETDGSVPVPRPPNSISILNSHLLMWRFSVTT